MHSHPALTRMLSMVVFILLWQAAVMLFTPDLLPAPYAVLTNLMGHVDSGELPHHLTITLRRIAISFLCAMLLGSLLGLVMGHFKRLEAIKMRKVKCSKNIVNYRSDWPSGGPGEGEVGVKVRS